MNFHSDEWIIEKVGEHYKEALQHFPEENIVGIFLQGSQNYGLDTENSDIDTKLIVTPTFRDIAMNHSPVSTTHVRANNEHIDFKDIRLYIQTFRKQNLNFMEILFTPYLIVNPMYAEEWRKLVSDREAICHMNPVRAVASMKGIAMEKYHALKHPYPSKLAILEKYGYDPKQLHHLLRVREFISEYIAGAEYSNILHPLCSNYLKEVKNGLYTLEEAEKIAEQTKEYIETLSSAYRETRTEKEDESVLSLLQDVQYNIMKISVEKELMR